MNRTDFVQGLRSNLEMSDADRRKIIRKSIKKFPWKLKCTVAMEEMQQAIDVKLQREREQLRE